MIGNCHECGSSLTVKEAGENRCCYCSGTVVRATVVPRPLKRRRVNLSFVRKNFDLMVAAELRKSDSPNI
jgi:DNA-directed RNA polymerase subunit M/transcription elongation factor TFIIS